MEGFQKTQLQKLKKQVSIKSEFEGPDGFEEDRIGIRGKSKKQTRDLVNLMISEKSGNQISQKIW